MSIIDDYRHAMDMVKKVESDQANYSAETRCFADLVRAVDNYHRETQKRADRVQSELTRCKGELAGMPHRLLLAVSAKQGWILDYKQILKISELTRNLEYVSMEETEAVMLAMVDSGFAHTERKNNDDPKS